MNLDEQIKQYFHLKAQQARLEGRLNELNRHIKRELAPPLSLKSDHTGYTYETADGYIATVQYVWPPIQVEDPLLQDLLAEKGLLEDATRTVVDRDLLDYLISQGFITVKELKDIGAKFEPYIQLKVDADV